MGAGAGKPPHERKMPSLIMLGHSAVGKTTLVNQVKLLCEVPPTPEEKRAGVDAMIKSLVATTMDVCDKLCDNFYDISNDVLISDEIFARFDEVSNINARLTTFIEDPDIFSKFSPNMSPQGRRLSTKGPGKSGRRMSVEMMRMTNPMADRQLLAQCLQEIWCDDVVQKTAQGLETSTLDKTYTYNNANMCRANLEHVFEPTFQITNNEFLRICNPTLLMNKLHCKLEDLAFQLIDIGGQLHFQAEWDAIVNQTKQTHDLSILYVISLSDYTNNESVGNRLEQSLMTWKKLLANKQMSDVPIILLLNKDDIFRANLATKPISSCPLLKHVADKKPDEDFEDYKLRCQQAILELFETMFVSERGVSEVEGGGNPLRLTSHITCATDQQQTQTVLDRIIRDGLVGF